MKEYPILFNGEMVRAILEGRKTQTRRVMIPQPGRVRWNPIVLNWFGGWTDSHGRPYRSPYGVQGDVLWVRETWQASPYTKYNFGPWYHDVPHSLRKRGVFESVFFRADNSAYAVDDDEDVLLRLDNQRASDEVNLKWKPSIHMPKWASRIRLKVEYSRPERLHELNHADIIAEGVLPVSYDDAPVSNVGATRIKWVKLWDSINRERGFPWESNPWVWVVKFKLMNQRGESNG